MNYETKSKWLGVGAMIGAGIFVLTGIAAGVAGPGLMLVFLLNGLIFILIGLLRLIALAVRSFAVILQGIAAAILNDIAVRRFASIIHGVAAILHGVPQVR